MILLPLYLLACEPTADDAGDDTATDTDTDSNADSYTLVVATVASDYTAGQLATVSGPSGVVTDAILPTTSDPTIESDGDKVFLIDRSAENTVRMYASPHGNGGNWSAPLVEFSTGDGTNPQDVAICGDTLVVSMLAEDHLGLWNAETGLARGTIDLSAWSDLDGSPEADAIVKGADGDLYVTLNQLDTSVTPWMSGDGTGTVLRIACDTLEVAEEWTTGPNPALMAHPVEPTKLLLRTGLYFDADYNLALDGALYTLDPAAGTISEPHLTEAALGYNIGAIAGGTDGKAILVGDDGYSWNVYCLDLSTWTATATPAVDSFIGDVVTAPDGTVWVGYRAGYAGTGAPVVEGLVAWHPATCTSSTLATTFPPYSMALVE